MARSFLLIGGSAPVAVRLPQDISGQMKFGSEGERAPFGDGFHGEI